jgi:AcrR family transcriptional regulator
LCTPPAPSPQGAATRSRIVPGTSARIRQHGVAATTLDDISAATGTSKGQLFHYFPDGREQLLLAVADYEADHVRDNQEPHLSRLNSWAAWQRWRDAVVERYRAAGIHCPLGILMTELGRSSPGSRAVTARLLGRWQDALETGIREMQRSGRMAQEIEPARAADAIVAAIQGGVVIHMSTGSIAHLEAALDFWLHFMRSGRSVALASTR